MIHAVKVVNADASTDKNLLLEIQRTLGISGITDVKKVKIYRLQGDPDLAWVRNFAEKVLVERITQEYVIGEDYSPIKDAKEAIEVGYLPGMMNPEVLSIMKAATDLGIKELKACDTSYCYHFFGSATKQEFQQITNRLLVNKTVQRVIDKPPKTLMISGVPGKVEKWPIRKLTKKQLQKFSADRELHLNLEEMLVIQNFFNSIQREPTDVEVETLAQTWSEHCGHKTFNAKVIVNGKEKPSLMYRLKQASKEWFDRVGVVSAFSDNSGVIKFYNDYGIMGKVETHNSPSAIEPYGGAATGSGGVFRDIAGTGVGAKVIASTDMFCFAPPNLHPDRLPKGCLHPNYLLRNVVAGVRDYGNRMGIPTNNGSVTFHEDFRAKPTVIVGAYGIAPLKYSRKAEPISGDRIFTVGGRTGRDGIHGATFSSGEMKANTITVNSTAVQIGNAIEEKRMFDALLEARDKELIRAITDCGAGGFSSAIGEMGAKTGAWVDLSKVPLKYTGLKAREIWISESQERMVVAVRREHAAEFVKVCASYNCEATDIGRFMNDQELVLVFDGQVVCDLPMDFIHNGLPQRVMNAHWQPPKRTVIPIPEPKDWLETYCKVLGHLDICSKEPIVRQYDHGVQGTNALPPFTGVKQDGPNDAVVLTPFPEEPYGMVISHGMNPRMMRLDPYYGTIWAATEAIANYVAVGGDIDSAGLIDNFIFPFPDEHWMGALDLSVDALVDFMYQFRMPCVSGKDSLSGTYRFKDDSKLDIPPVLCISVFGRIPDVFKTVTSDFKRVGSQIVLLGQLDLEDECFAGSVYTDIQRLKGMEYGKRIPRPTATRNLFITLHEQIKAGRILSCHDISQGGAAVTLAEMCFGGGVGADFHISALGHGSETAVSADLLFFNETPGCFLVEIPSGFDPDEMFFGLPHRLIGRTIPQPVICARIGASGEVLFAAGLERLRKAWQTPMQEVFHAN